MSPTRNAFLSLALLAQSALAASSTSTVLDGYWAASGISCDNAAALPPTPSIRILEIQGTRGLIVDQELSGECRKVTPLQMEPIDPARVRFRPEKQKCDPVGCSKSCEKAEPIQEWSFRLKGPILVMETPHSCGKGWTVTRYFRRTPGTELSESPWVDLSSFPVRWGARWKTFDTQPSFKVPLVDRLRLPPEDLVNYVGIYNSVYPSKPIPLKGEPKFLPSDTQVYREAILSLPPAVAKLAQEKVASYFGIFNLGASGITFSALAPDARTESVITIFDLSVLRQNANSWATAREMTAIPAGDWNVQIRLENENEDSPANALKFLLLHELGHALDDFSFFTHSGDTELIPTNLGPNEAPFARISWNLALRPFVLFHEMEFPERDQIRFYQNKSSLSAASVLDAYSKLHRYGIPSLYAAQDPREDFAESFAIYVHSILEKKPYRITVFRKGKRVKEFTSCIADGSCPEKHDFIAKILSQ